MNPTGRAQSIRSHRKPCNHNLIALVDSYAIGDLQRRETARVDMDETQIRNRRPVVNVPGRWIRPQSTDSEYRESNDGHPFVRNVMKIENFRGPFLGSPFLQPRQFS